jgi:hypothetical protein
MEGTSMRLIFAIMVMLLVNVGLFMLQVTTNNLAVSESLGNVPQIYNYNSSYASRFDSGGYNIEGYASNASGVLPQVGSSTATSGTTIVVDIASQIVGWVTSTTGLNYLWGIVDAVPSFLKQIGLPAELSFILGVLWHVITVILIVIFIRGGGY